MTSQKNKPTEPHAAGSDSTGIGSTKETKHAVYKMLSEALRSPSHDDNKPVFAKNSGSKQSRLGKSSKESSTGISSLNETKRKPRDLLNPSHSATNTSFPGSAIGDSNRNQTSSRPRTSIPNKEKLENDFSNKNSEEFTRRDLPMGLIPPSMKDCHLSNVLRSARRSLEALREVRDNLSNLVAEDEHLSRGMKKINPTPELIQLSRVAESITILSREAFVPAHRLNQTAIALYNAEDFLRYPTDLRTFDILASGRIKLPEPSFNSSTIEKLRLVVDKATACYNGFDGKGSMSQDLQDIHFTLMRAFQDLYTCTLGCQEVFKVLLYTGPTEKQHLQQFLLSLPSMERSDMLTEVQDLRRLVDELVIFLEKLSWGSFVVYRLASGKSVTPSPDEIPMGTPKFEALQSYAVHPDLRPKENKLKDPENKKASKLEKQNVMVGNKVDEQEQFSHNKLTMKNPRDASVTSKKKLKSKKSVLKGKSKKDKEAIKADLSGLENDGHVFEAP